MRERKWKLRGHLQRHEKLERVGRRLVPIFHTLVGDFTLYRLANSGKLKKEQIMAKSISQGKRGSCPSSPAWKSLLSFQHLVDDFHEGGFALQADEPFPGLITAFEKQHLRNP